MLSGTFSLSGSCGYGVSSVRTNFDANIDCYKKINIADPFTLQIQKNVPSGYQTGQVSYLCQDPSEQQWTFLEGVKSKDSAGNACSSWFEINYVTLQQCQDQCYGNPSCRLAQWRVNLIGDEECCHMSYDDFGLIEAYTGSTHSTFNVYIKRDKLSNPLEVSQIACITLLSPSSPAAYAYS